ncbi:MAG: HypC/HybG/HupF family hydrogenase formation chaperone [Gammaproteobacteria bacterium]|nr:MAG: HypC/HybG/HupF family hydrogenase formation chaperone [Gammaproteobacteria bacterium]
MCLAVPGKVLAITDRGRQQAEVEIGGVRRAVSLACLLEEGVAPESLLGCWVLVHVGYALSLIDEQEARQTLELLKELEPDALR